ncbi:unnamed protein product [Dovyalis caffra]|uniref:Uncharacterized protein n=1 Tax=Dovyalis caffra TaxID=77055 RepID=A0AAV1RC30_9ROSI|nr:unnamed protein product [Dovyalis caffra]
MEQLDILERKDSGAKKISASEGIGFWEREIRTSKRFFSMITLALQASEAVLPRCSKRDMDTSSLQIGINHPTAKRAMILEFSKDTKKPQLFKLYKSKEVIYSTNNANKAIIQTPKANNSNLASRSWRLGRSTNLAPILGKWDPSQDPLKLQVQTNCS